MTIDWATPMDFPNLPIISTIPYDPGKPAEAEFIYPDGKRSHPFTIKIFPGHRSLSVAVPVPWQWDAEPVYKPSFPSIQQYRAWPPGDFTVTALSLRAKALTLLENREFAPQLFEGSLLGGIDIKTTLRSHIKGERRLYVKTSAAIRNHERHQHFEGIMFDPGVIIFRQDKSGLPQWLLHSGNMMIHHRHHLQKPQFLDEAAREKGSYAVTAVSCVEYGTVSGRIRKAGIQMNVLSGISFFIRPVFTVFRKPTGWKKQNIAEIPSLMETESVVLLICITTAMVLILIRAPGR